MNSSRRVSRLTDQRIDRKFICNYFRAATNLHYWSIRWLFSLLIIWPVKCQEIVKNTVHRDALCFSLFFLNCKLNIFGFWRIVFGHFGNFIGCIFYFFWHFMDQTEKNICRLPDKKIIISCSSDVHVYIRFSGLHLYFVANVSEFLRRESTSCWTACVGRTQGKAWVCWSRWELISSTVGTVTDAFSLCSCNLWVYYLQRGWDSVEL